MEGDQYHVYESPFEHHTHHTVVYQLLDKAWWIEQSNDRVTSRKWKRAARIDTLSTYLGG